MKKNVVVLKMSTNGSSWCYKSISFDNNSIYYGENENITSSDTNLNIQDKCLFVELEPKENIIQTTVKKKNIKNNRKINKSKK